MCLLHRFYQNMATQQAKIKYLYKRTVEPGYWKSYLSRNLTNDEKFILSSAKSEQHTNKEIEMIYQYASAHGLYIPNLTSINGNCLFESFQYVGLCEDHKLFRTGIAQLLLILKNVPNFLPGFAEPLCQVFNNFKPEVDFVKCAKTGKVYKYDYDAMCVDLATDTSWTRVHTQLIMTILCVLLNINIVIYRSDGHITHTNDNVNENTMNIYLGHVRRLNKNTGQLEDFHYIPLKLREGTEQHQCLTYTTDLTEYHKWARAMCKSLGRFEIESSDKTV